MSEPRRADTIRIEMTVCEPVETVAYPKIAVRLKYEDATLLWHSVERALGYDEALLSEIKQALYAGAQTMEKAVHALNVVARMIDGLGA